MSTNRSQIALQVFETTFADIFANGGSKTADEKGAALAPFVLYKAASVTGGDLGSRDPYDARALEAAKLLHALPVVRGVFLDGSSSEQLVQTRTILWTHILQGVFFGAETLRAKHLRNLLAPIERLSTPEEKAFRECIRSRFPEDRPHTVKLVFKAFKTLAGPFEEVALRSLLQGFARHLDQDLLLSMVRAVPAQV